MDESASQPIPDGQRLLAKRIASAEPNSSAEIKHTKTSHHKSPEPDAHAQAQASINKWEFPFRDKVCAMNPSLSIVAAGI